MFVTCARRTAMSDGGGMGRKPEGGAIDLHCHWESRPIMERMRLEADRLGKISLNIGSDLTREVNRRQMAEVLPMMESVDRRLADMDRMGVEIQALAHFPPQMYYWASPEVAEGVFRELNEGLAEVIAAAPGRLIGMGNVPLQDTSLAIRELRHCRNDLGFKGIQIATRVEEEELSAPRLEPFWDDVEATGTVVVIHSNGHDNVGRLGHHYMINVFGHPMEATLAAGHLIFGGVMERHPDLKIVLVHGGGYLPTYAARMEHAYHAREDVREGLPHPPSEYLKRFYLDTMVFAEDQLRFLVEKYGADKVVVGTDYPYDMGETDPVGLVRRALGDAEAQIAAVTRQNAAKLLGLGVS